MTRVVIHSLTQAAVLLSETVIRTCYYTQLNSRTLGKNWAGEWLWDILKFEHKLCIRTDLRFHPFKNGTENTFFSGSHHQTPSFPLVHGLSITDSHTEEEQPGTDLALLSAHPLTSRESRAQRWQTEPVLHIPQKKIMHTWKKVWVVQKKESSVW